MEKHLQLPGLGKPPVRVANAIAASAEPLPARKPNCRA
jgi:hypothetical protein